MWTHNKSEQLLLYQFYKTRMHECSNVNKSKRFLGNFAEKLGHILNGEDAY